MDSKSPSKSATHLHGFVILFWQRIIWTQPGETISPKTTGFQRGTRGNSHEIFRFWDPEISMAYLYIIPRFSLNFTGQRFFRGFLKQISAGSLLGSVVVGMEGHVSGCGGGQKLLPGSPKPFLKAPLILGILRKQQHKADFFMHNINWR